jgi:hypothetical protein
LRYFNIAMLMCDCLYNTTNLLITVFVHSTNVITNTPNWNYWTCCINNNLRLNFKRIIQCLCISFSCHSFINVTRLLRNTHNNALSRDKNPTVTGVKQQLKKLQTATRCFGCESLHSDKFIVVNLNFFESNILNVLNCFNGQYLISCQK